MLFVRLSVELLIFEVEINYSFTKIILCNIIDRNLIYHSVAIAKEETQYDVDFETLLKNLISEKII